MSAPDIRSALLAVALSACNVRPVSPGRSGPATASAIVYQRNGRVLLGDRMGAVLASGDLSTDSARIIQAGIDGLAAGGELYIADGSYVLSAPADAANVL